MTRLARANGSGHAFSACALVLTSACTNLVDANFDRAHARVALPCEPGAVRACYDGAEGTAGVGQCVAGQATCDPSGQSWGPCVGQVLPGVETTTTPTDESCDGFTGNHRWSRAFGDPGNPSPVNRSTQNLVSDSGGTALYAGGYFKDSIVFGDFPLAGVGESSGWLAKLDATDGRPIWAKAYGTGWMTVKDVAATPTGGVIVMGRFAEGVADLGGTAFELVEGEHTGYLAELDADGEHVWSTVFGGKGGVVPVRIACSPQGEVAVTGWYNDELGFDGTAELFGQGGLFVAKYQAGGVYAWSRAFVDGEVPVTEGIAFDAHGNLVMSGSYIDSSFGTEPESFVLVLGPDGSKVWSKSLGPTAYYAGGGLALAGDGDIVVAQSLEGEVSVDAESFTSAGESDLLLLKLDGDDGELVWAKQFGDVARQRAFRLHAAADGTILFVGSFDGTIDFGLPLLVSNGLDAFLVKLSAEGQPLWVRRRSRLSAGRGGDRRRRDHRRGRQRRHRRPFRRHGGVRRRDVHRIRLPERRRGLVLAVAAAAEGQRCPSVGAGVRAARSELATLGTDATGMSVAILRPLERATPQEKTMKSESKKDPRKEDPRKSSDQSTIKVRVRTKVRAGAKDTCGPVWPDG
jgi:outer membrane protein assembly factor BamB